ncbi:MAG: carbamoyltransferase C-terminal domain-containing protein [Kofleriaceae bacterium]
MKTILGIGGSDHDVHACLIRDGKVVITVEEERLCRRKYGLGGNLLDGLSRQHALETAGITLDDVDEVVVDSILAPTALMGVRSRAKKLDHHVAHAASSYYTSGFDSAAVLVVDNAGELVKGDGPASLQATTWYRAEGRQISLIDRVTSPNFVEGPAVLAQVYQRGDGDDSLGHLYKKTTGALGFRYPPEARKDPKLYYFPEDGITMGLSAYGDLRFFEELWTLVELQPAGRYRIALTDGRMDAMLARWLAGEPSFEVRAAVAAAAQEALSRLMIHLVTHVVTVTGQRRLCLAGGVAMNTVTNGRLLRDTPIDQLYVPPMPGDNGTGVGAALWAAAQDREHPLPVYSVYGGRRYSEAEIREALTGLDTSRYTIHEPSHEELLARVAQLILDQKVVAWFEGGAEGGRRALGHRSILADPRPKAMRDHLNENVKRRQWFRPYAPMVPEERVQEFFDLAHPSPYMQLVMDVQPAWKERIQAAAHVDGSARLQTIHRDQHPRMYQLLHAFEKLSGVPIILNTSFNVANEPMVETPADAIRCFTGTNIDALVLENHLVLRR